MENVMKRTAAACLVSATVCAISLAASPSWAQALQYNPYSYTYPNSYAYGYGYGYPSYDYGTPLSIVTAPIAAVTALPTALAAPRCEGLGMSSQQGQHAKDNASQPSLGVGTTALRCGPFPA